MRYDFLSNWYCCIFSSVQWFFKTKYTHLDNGITLAMVMSYLHAVCRRWMITSVTIIFHTFSDISNDVKIFVSCPRELYVFDMLQIYWHTFVHLWACASNGSYLLMQLFLQMQHSRLVYPHVLILVWQPALSNEYKNSPSRNVKTRYLRNCAQINQKTVLFLYFLATYQ